MTIETKKWWFLKIDMVRHSKQIKCKKIYSIFQSKENSSIYKYTNWVYTIISMTSVYHQVRQKEVSGLILILKTARARTHTTFYKRFRTFPSSFPHIIIYNIFTMYMYTSYLIYTSCTKYICIKNKMWIVSILIVLIRISRFGKSNEGLRA